jgi:hypothetical protein
LCAIFLQVSHEDEAVIGSTPKPKSSLVGGRFVSSGDEYDSILRGEHLNGLRYFLLLRAAEETTNGWKVDLRDTTARSWTTYPSFR